MSSTRARVFSGFSGACILAGREPSPREERPTLQAVYRGQHPSELVLVDTAGHAVLLRGDGWTEEESIRMAQAAHTLLGGAP